MSVGGASLNEDTRIAYDSSSTLPGRSIVMHNNMTDLQLWYDGMFSIEHASDDCDTTDNDICARNDQVGPGGEPRVAIKE